jgi:formamidopyrimidine-DNA glycosylase
LVWRPKLADTDNEQYQGKQVVGGHPSGDWNATLPNKHTRVEINFTDGSVLFFNDLRKFGWVRLVRLKDLIDLVNKMPPDVLDKRFTSEWLATALSKTSKAVKLVLMDQEKIGGIGNIYANDALNLAKTNPKRPAKSLKPDEIKKLHGAVKKVIDLGIKFGGASYSDYRDSRGQGGKYQEHFLVYGREGEKCKNCGHKLEKFQLGGRGTYWCPNCQV